MTNNKQQTEINAVEYLDKVNQFAKENNTDKPRQQTAVEWLWNQLPEILPFTVDTETAVKLQQAYQQAKQIEKEQIIQAILTGFSNWDTELGSEQYYNETYGGGEQ
jgi:uncharacterized membrane-anchored protein